MHIKGHGPHPEAAHLDALRQQVAARVVGHHCVCSGDDVSGQGQALRQN